MAVLGVDGWRGRWVGALLDGRRVTLLDATAVLAVPEVDLPGLAADAAERGGNLANPKPAGPDEIEQLLRDVY